MTAALEGGEWSAARPGRTLPPGKTRYPFYRRLGVPQGRSGRAENLVPTGIRSQTIQAVASRYTDWATRPKQFLIKYRLFFQWLLETGTISRDLAVFLCEIQGSIRRVAGKCQVTQPCILSRIFHDVGKVPKHGELWVLVAKEVRCAEAWSGTWQANSNCIMLHGKKVGQPTQWWQRGGGVEVQHHLSWTFALDGDE